MFWVHQRLCSAEVIQCLWIELVEPKLGRGVIWVILLSQVGLGQLIAYYTKTEDWSTSEGDQSCNRSLL